MTYNAHTPPDSPASQNRGAPIDRRRPGRRAWVSPELVAMLRSPHQVDPEAEEPPEDWDVPRPAAVRL